MSEEKVSDFYGLLGMKVDQGSFDAANKILGAVKKGIAAFVGFKITQGIVGAIDDVVELGGKFNDASAKTGVAADTLQEYSFGAGLAGVASDELIGSLGKLNKGLAEAASKGTGNAADGLRALGISLQDPAVKAQNLDEILLEVSDKFQKMPDGPKKVAAAMDLFGKSGANLIPFLNQGGDGIQAMKKEAIALGVVIDNDTIGHLDDFGDNLDRVKAGWQGVKNQAVAAILPLLSDLMPGLIALAKDAVAWTKAHREEIAAFAFAFGKTVKTIVVGIVEVVKALVVIFKAVGQAIGTAIGWIVTKAQEFGRQIADAFGIMRDFALEVASDVKSAWQAVADFFVGVGRGIKDAFVDAFTWVEAKIADIKKALFDFAADVGNSELGKQLGFGGAGNVANQVREQGFAPQGGAPILERRRIEKLNDERERAGLPPLDAPSLPPGSVTGSGSTSSTNVDMSQSVTITAPPGSDEAKIAQLVGEQTAKMLTDVFRHSINNTGAPPKGSL